MKILLKNSAPDKSRILISNISGCYLISLKILRLNTVRKMAKKISLIEGLLYRRIKLFKT